MMFHFFHMQFHHFKTMTKEASKISIGKFKVNSTDLEGLMEDYQAALHQLPQVLKVNRLLHTQLVTSPCVYTPT